jgi:hypothetical protein
VCWFESSLLVVLTHLCGIASISAWAILCIISHNESRLLEFAWDGSRHSDGGSYKGEVILAGIYLLPYQMRWSEHTCDTRVTRRNARLTHHIADAQLPRHSVEALGVIAVGDERGPIETFLLGEHALLSLLLVPHTLAVVAPEVVVGLGSHGRVDRLRLGCGRTARIEESCDDLLDGGKLFVVGVGDLRRVRMSGDGKRSRTVTARA